MGAICTSGSGFEREERRPTVAGQQRILTAFPHPKWKNDITLGRFPVTATPV
jgi:hypothetical protein